MDDDTITLRERDSMQQVRLPIDRLIEELRGRLAGPTTAAGGR